MNKEEQAKEDRLLAVVFGGLGLFVAVCLLKVSGILSLSWSIISIPLWLFCCVMLILSAGFGFIVTAAVIRLGYKIFRPRKKTD